LRKRVISTESQTFNNYEIRKISKEQYETHEIVDKLNELHTKTLELVDYQKINELHTETIELRKIHTLTKCSEINFTSQVIMTLEKPHESKSKNHQHRNRKNRINRLNKMSLNYIMDP
jgi:hypothetical protein